MTDKQKRNDVFWFSFFHEIGHILLHGKKDIFLEDKAMTFDNLKKEQEADHFASNILLPYPAELEIISSNDFSRDTIIASARKYHTHPVGLNELVKGADAAREGDDGHCVTAHFLLSFGHSLGPDHF